MRVSGKRKTDVREYRSLPLKYEKSETIFRIVYYSKFTAADVTWKQQMICNKLKLIMKSYLQNREH